MSICCIFNFAAHYRESIYKLLDRELMCDFFIGDKASSPIKKMNFRELNGFKRILINKHLLGNYYWQKGAVKLIFKPYNKYILTGEPYCLSTWIILLLSKLFGKETYLWSHGYYGDEKSIKKIVKKLFFALSKKVFLYGDYARNIMIKEGFDPDKLICIYNSLNHTEQLKIRNGLSKTKIYMDYFGNDFPVLLYIGRIQKEKKIEILIDALDNLNKIGKYCNLIIIGQEIDGYYIQQQVSDFKLTKSVWLYGECYDEHILGELIYNADLCISPGNVGLTAIHSMTYGTPVLTHTNYCNHGPEFETIIQDVTGCFYLEDSVDSLSENIIKWLDTTRYCRNMVREKCYEIIDSKYNPNVQISIFKRELALS